MDIKMFSVFDVKAAVYGAPFFMPNAAVAIRTFVDNVNQDHPNNNWFKHPEDFTLYHLGTFDDSLGTVQSLEHPVPLCTAASVKKAVKPSLPPEIVNSIVSNGREA